MGNKVVGERIEYRRKQLGLRLEDIANEIGVAKSTIQRYERGTIETIKLPVIEAIANIMSVNPAWLCGKTDDMEPEEYAENLSTVLKRRRKELGLTLLQIAEAMDVSEATVQRWESGNIKMLRHERIAKLAQVLKVSPSSLMGWGDFQQELPSNIIPLPKMKKIPLVGQIACGTPILAEQNIEEYIDLPSHIHADFALTCKGESMVNIGIHSGDIVYIRQQEEVENGQVAAVMVGDEEATLKRFYRTENVVQLVAENSAIPPSVFIGEEINQIRVVGLALAYTHIIE